MAGQPYKPVSWSNEAVTNAKLQQMANNDQFLFESAPTVVYRVSGVSTSQGIKILAGKTAFPNHPDTYIDVITRFGSVFSPGCFPVITVAVNAPGYRKKGITIQRIGPDLFPDTGPPTNEGFLATIYAEEGFATTITNGVLNWIAVGY